MPRHIRRDNAAISSLVGFVALVIVILIALGIYYALLPRPPAAPLRAEEGDEVLVNYIGTFEGTDLVFDTTLLSVAVDNVSFPKAVSFYGQPIGSAWKEDWGGALFGIGSGTTSPRAVPGFENGLLGMAKGESRTIVVIPEDGYGPMDAQKLVVRQLLEPVPVRERMDATEFRSRYGLFPASGENVSDPIWGWPVTVSVAGDVVTVANSPAPGQIVRPYDAWDATVVSLDDAANGGEGLILVEHNLDPTMTDRVGAKYVGESFYLWQVDLAGGTFTLNWNSQVIGRTLTFRVELIQIIRQ